MAMSPGVKIGIGVGGGILLSHLLLPGMIAWILTLAILGAPVVAWFALSPQQRRRLMRIRERGQLGR